MDTQVSLDGLSQTLFGAARRAVLALLYGHADEEFYLRQIVRMTGMGVGPIQREVRALAQAGIIRRRVHGHQVYFRADASSPIFTELRGIVTKTVGAGDQLRAALQPLKDRLRVAFIYGSVARGTENGRSDIDVMVIGDVTFAEVCDAVTPTQDALNREVNVTVYPVREFQEKARAGHYFVSEVLRGDKVFLIGDKNELGRVA
jgi:predicted nucleotidyltransferase